MQVEDIYNKNILAPTFGIINNSTTQSIEVIGAYTENPGQNPNATNVLQAGGISQPATYWKFRLSKEQTKGNGTNPSGILIAIRTPELTPNTYTFKLAKNSEKTLILILILSLNKLMKMVTLPKNLKYIHMEQQLDLS